MTAFRHITPPWRLYCGPDSLTALGRELDRLNCRRAVVFCGASLLRQPQALALVLDVIGERCAGVYGRVAAHSPLPDVEAAARELARLQADAVIAVGGGSAVVTARAASILLAEAGNARELCTTRDGSGVLRSPKLPAPKLPQLVVPTTPTTASIKAGSALLDPLDGRRLALFDPKTRASAVFVHPGLVATAPAELIVSAALNTLAMAMEGLMSRSGDPISDALLIHALHLLARHLPEVGRGDDIHARIELVNASLICGHGTDYTGAGIAIPLGHAVSARFHVDNGIANAVLMPHVLRFNAEAATAGMDKMSRALASHVAREASPGSSLGVVTGWLATLMSELELARRLRDIGVTLDSLPELAAVSMEDWFVRDNPRPVRAADELLQVLTDAW